MGDKTDKTKDSPFDIQRREEVKQVLLELVQEGKIKMRGKEEP